MRGAPLVVLLPPFVGAVVVPPRVVSVVEVLAPPLVLDAVGVRTSLDAVPGSVVVLCTSVVEVEITADDGDDEDGIDDEEVAACEVVKLRLDSGVTDEYCEVRMSERVFVEVVVRRVVSLGWVLVLVWVWV